MDVALHIALTDGDSIAKSPREANPERRVAAPRLSAARSTPRALDAALATDIHQDSAGTASPMSLTHGGISDSAPHPGCSFRPDSVMDHGSRT